jgi:nucleotide-binding universal stress UspA family protein
VAEWKAAMKIARAKELTMNTPRHHIVVGVVKQQPSSLLEQAAFFAKQFDADLVCAYVDSGRYLEQEKADGTVISLSFDPDLVDRREEKLDPELQAQLTEVLDRHDVVWSSRALAGDAARALSHLAEQVDAAFIIVGTRQAGIRRSMHEFFDGSVGARLAHLQRRPVLIIPLSPVSQEADLPWTN